MKKFFMIITMMFLATSLCLFAAQKNRNVKYAGKYSFSYENGASGDLVVYPENDKSILFYLELSNGAPAYHMGSLYGRIKMNGNKGVYDKKFEFYEDNQHCAFKVTFEKDNVVIQTVDTMNYCGFGANVYVDGKYKKMSGKVSEYFENLEGKKFYFEKNDPESFDAY